MSTSYVYNGYGPYEERDGKVGVYLTHGGQSFFFPFEEVVAIPNWIFRELDHDRSTPVTGQQGQLVYMNVIVNGDRIAKELTENQKPVPPHDMGVTIIDGKATGQTIRVFGGYTDEGEAVMVDVAEREAAPAERAKAAALAKAYKQRVLAEYFQSKRERMTGASGRLHPTERERAYMDELGVEDIDDVTTHQKQTGGLDAAAIRTIMEVARESTQVNATALLAAVESVRRGGKAQLQQKIGRALTPSEIERNAASSERFRKINEKRKQERAAKELAAKE